MIYSYTHMVTVGMKGFNYFGHYIATVRMLKRHKTLTIHSFTQLVGILATSVNLLCLF